MAQNGIDPHEEVRKLQNLVRQLEIQNQQLRNIHNQNNAREIFTEPKKHENGYIEPKLSQKEKIPVAPLDEIEILDLDEMELSDEESWLFTPTKDLTKEQRSVSPIKWVRQDIENFENKELQLARRALAIKLDELSTCSPHIIDTRTFTRANKKRRQLLPDFRADMNGVSGNANWREKSPLALNSTLDRTPDEASPDLDVAGVHKIARLQEESLRKSSLSGSRLNSVNNSSSSLLNNTYVIDDDEEEEDDASYSSKYSQDHPKSVTSNHACPSPSNSSPSESPYGSSNSLDNTSRSVNKLRPPDNYALGRSLPNLAKPYSNIRSPKLYNGEARQIFRSNRMTVTATNNCQPPSQAWKLNETVTLEAQKSSKGSQLKSRSRETFRVPPNAARRSSVPVQNGPQSRIPAVSRIRSAIPVSSRQPASNQIDNWSEGCY